MIPPNSSISTTERQHFLNIIRLLVVGIAFLLLVATEARSDSRATRFNSGWSFFRSDANSEASPSSGSLPADMFGENFDDRDWQQVHLPHTARIEPLVVVDQWQGTCWYRKRFSVASKLKDKKLFLKFEAAMQVADVWINGHHKTTHQGGYLPFTIDITDEVIYGDDENGEGRNVVAVRLNNEDNPQVPPGRLLERLDFCMYGGLYRNVWLVVTDRLHVTDPVAANREAGGGVFVTCTQLSETQATIQIKTHVRNERDEQTMCKVQQLLFDPDGNIVTGQGPRKAWKMAAGADRSWVEMHTVGNPLAWHPDHPHLYTLRTIVSDENGPVDVVETRIGLRRIAFSAEGGFQINGERMFLRGTNRHQEYPYLGYALSDNAQYRDARKIKEAGFDYIRLSHYPHAPAFLDACDELGLVVMNCIPGWQFMGDDAFQQVSFQNCRDMIRRDRNHPSVILWEVSLNETEMDEQYIKQTHQIAHEELSFTKGESDQCFTCGWVDPVYDLFIQARQHGGCRDYKNGDKACVISEYGDWEYYAQNAGLDQPGFKNLKKADRNSRQLRGAGEKRLLQQAMNFQEAHNDNLSTPAIGDGLWVMFDYNRGYSDDLEASGPMDIFRLPKPAFYFFQSQRSPELAPGPMVHIASQWNRESSQTIRVFSNCQEVALTVNDRLIERRRPTRDAFSDRLSHPPFHFKLEAFEAGQLQAVGFIDGQEVARHEVTTAGPPARLVLRVDQSGRPLEADGADAVFVYASVVDNRGMLVTSAQRPITFQLSGPAHFVGKNPQQAEAGIATILLQSNAKDGPISITASAEGLEPVQHVVRSK